MAGKLMQYRTVNSPKATVLGRCFLLVNLDLAEIEFKHKNLQLANRIEGATKRHGKETESLPVEAYVCGRYILRKS